MRFRIPAGAAVTTLATALVLSLSAAAWADSSNKVKFKQRVSLKVGQAMVINGYRGECGSLPEKAKRDKAAERLNSRLTTGRIQFGKPGVRKSGSCNGWTPVYETIFVATTPGREKLKIHGDMTTFIVKE